MIEARERYDVALVGIARRRDQLLPALHAAHALDGWLPDDAIAAVARHVFVPLSEVYGIVTSYNELRLAPPPADREEVCDGLSCRIAGGDGWAALLQEHPAAERVPCRFLCGVAPVMQTHGTYIGATERGFGGGSRPFVAPSSRIGTDRAIVQVDVEDSLCARAAGSASVFAVLGGLARGVPVRAVGCDGRCYAQPAITVHRADGSSRRYETVFAVDVPAILSGTLEGVSAPGRGERRVLGRLGMVDPESLESARDAGAYEALGRARSLGPDELVALMQEAGLRGRGGAYFPTAIKWRSAREFAGPRYLVVNAEEGEPGVFKDRHLLEGDPHAVLEGALIAAHAVGTERIFFYVNGQAELAAERLGHAVAEARTAGLFSDSLGGAVDVVIYRGAGGYVCGEESVILNSIEGERAVPRLRPPLPTERGLWGRPTVINNVETLANLPLIVEHGSVWFRSVGTDAFPGTKLLSLSGAVACPGLYELPMGATVQEALDAAGGPATGSAVRAVLAGGPSGGLLPPDLFDLQLVGGTMHPSGPVLGAGGLVALGDGMSVDEALRLLNGYNRAESCGKCTPCREGTARAQRILDSATGRALSGEERDELDLLCDVMASASLCGLGQMAPGPIRSVLQLFEV